MRAWVKRSQYMSIYKIITILPLAIPFALSAACSPGIWQNMSSTSYMDPLNWQGGCVPVVPGDSALFPMIVGSSSQTIDLDMMVNLSSNPGPTLDFSSALTSYTIFSSTGQTMLIGSGGNTEIISVTGLQTFGNGVPNPDLVHFRANSPINVIGTGTLQIVNAGMSDTIASLMTSTINGPSVTVSNTQPVSGAINGSQFMRTGFLTMTGGALDVSNISSVVNNTGLLSGAYFGSEEDLTLSNVAITGTNSGTVGDRTMGIFGSVNYGSLIGVTGANFGNMILTDCSIMITNTGDAEFGIGAALENTASGNITFNQCTITAMNNADLIGPMNPGTGSVIGTIISSGPILGGFPGDITMNGGVINLINTGSLSGDNRDLGILGSFIESSVFRLNSGGSIYMINSGTISQPAVGSINNAGVGFEAATSLTITDGLIVNNGTIGTPVFNIHPAGTLSGIGIVAGGDPGVTDLSLINEGTILPGNPGLGGIPTLGVTDPGVLTVIGDYVQTGNLNINILNTGTFSQLVINPPSMAAGGTAIVSGNAQIAVVPGFSLHPTDTFQILQAPGDPITGNLNPINFNLPPGFVPLITNFSTFLLLSFETAFSKLVVGLPGYFSDPIISSVNQYNQMSRLSKLACECIEEEENCSDLYCDCDHCFCEYNQWNFYFAPKSLEGRFKSGDDLIGFNYWSVGGLVGFDYVSTNFGIGLSTAYEKFYEKVHRSWGRVDIDDIHASLYAKFVPRCNTMAAVNAIVGAGYEFYHIRRNIPDEPSAKGSPRGNEVDALLGIEYTLHSLNEENVNWDFQFIPHLSAQYIRVAVDDYTEHGGGLFNLKFNQHHQQSLRSILGFKANCTTSGCDFCFTPGISFDWQREFLYKEESIYFTSAEFPEPTASLLMPAAGRNIFLAGVDLNLAICDEYEIEACYNFEWNSLFLSNYFYLGTGFRF